MCFRQTPSLQKANHSHTRRHHPFQHQAHRLVCTECRTIDCIVFLYSLWCLATPDTMPKRGKRREQHNALRAFTVRPLTSHPSIHSAYDAPLQSFYRPLHHIKQLQKTLVQGPVLQATTRVHYACATFAPGLLLVVWVSKLTTKHSNTNLHFRGSTSRGL